MTRKEAMETLVGIVKGIHGLTLVPQISEAVQIAEELADTDVFDNAECLAALDKKDQEIADLQSQLSEKDALIGAYKLQSEGGGDWS